MSTIDYVHHPHPLTEKKRLTQPPQIADSPPQIAGATSAKSGENRRNAFCISRNGSQRNMAMLNPPAVHRTTDNAVMLDGLTATIGAYGARRTAP